MTTFNIKQVEDSFKAIRNCFKGEYDVLITDPPYSRHVQDNIYTGSLVGLKTVPKYKLEFKPLEAENRNWISGALYATKRWVLSFCEIEACGIYSEMYPKEYVRSGVWYKPNSMGQMQKDRPATAYEGIAILHGTRHKKKWNGNGSHGIWKCNGSRGLFDRHPNEKPIDLCLKLVALFSEKGETVFDPFCGSGAIGEACLALGRNYVGWEQNPKWVARATERCANTCAYMRDKEALKLCGMNVREFE